MATNPQVGISSKATQLLSQYGIKDAAQLKAYLLSPGGTKVKNLIYEQVSLLAAMQENKQRNMLEDLLRMMHIKALSFLLAVYRKKAHAKKLNEAIQRQIDQMVAQGRKNAAKKAAKQAEYYESAPRQIYFAYGIAEQMIDSTLAEKLKEAQQLEEELALLEEERKEIEERYKVFTTKLDELDDLYDSFEASNKPTTDKISDLRAKMVELQAEIKSKQEKINRLIKEKNEDKASKHQHKLHALNAKAEGMEDILAVLEDRKLFYNAAGERVSSYRMAEFALDKEQRLYTHNGVTYLLTVGKDFDHENLPQVFNSLSPEAKQAAQDSFEHAKPDISNAKTLVNSNMQTELALHGEKREKLLQRSDNLQKEILDLTNQSATVASLMEQVSTELKSANVVVPRPTPTAPKSAGATQIYKHILQLMSANPTETAIARLKNGFILPNGQPNKEAQELISKQITPGMPISAVTMQSLLTNLGRFGVSPNKPSVTNIPDKTPTQTAPTPFKKTPF